MTARQIERWEWVVGILVTVAALAAWLASSPLSSLNLYRLFPLFGLIAFSLMWTHFVFGATRKHFSIPASKTPYTTISMILVLVLIILHPGLLWLALYMDGLGLPPFSAYQAYSSQLLPVVLGSIALVIFLAYEFKRVFGGKPWWKYVETLQVIGMAAIFYHSLSLGNELSSGWLPVLWWFYGISLIVAVWYSWWHNRRGGSSDE